MPVKQKQYTKNMSKQTDGQQINGQPV